MWIGSGSSAETPIGPFHISNILCIIHIEEVLTRYECDTVFLNLCQP